MSKHFLFLAQETIAVRPIEQDGFVIANIVMVGCINANTSQHTNAGNLKALKQNLQQ